MFTHDLYAHYALIPPEKNSRKKKTLTLLKWHIQLEQRQHKHRANRGRRWDTLSHPFSDVTAGIKPVGWSSETRTIIIIIIIKNLAPSDHLRLLVPVRLQRLDRHAGDLRVSLCASHPRALSGAGGARLVLSECAISANV